MPQGSPPESLTPLNPFNVYKKQVAIFLWRKNFMIWCSLGKEQYYNMKKFNFMVMHICTWIQLEVSTILTLKQTNNNNILYCYCYLATREKKGTNRTWPEALPDLHRISRKTIQGVLRAKLPHELVWPSLTQSVISETFLIFIQSDTMISHRQLIL